MKKCGCRKLGLKCSNFCKSCKGQTCENCEVNDDVNEEFNIENEMDTSIFEPDVTIDCIDEDGDYTMEDATEELVCSTMLEENPIQYMEDD